jgi:hypothetical protein
MQRYPELSPPFSCVTSLASALKISTLYYISGSESKVCRPWGLQGLAFILSNGFQLYQMKDQLFLEMAWHVKGGI